MDAFPSKRCPLQHRRKQPMGDSVAAIRPMTCQSASASGRACGAPFPSTTLVALQATTSSPPIHVSVSRLLVSTWLLSPVSGSRLTDSDERVETCRAPAGVLKSGVGCAVFMDASVFARHQTINIQKSEIRI